MDTYELIIMTPNGAIVGTFDEKDEANDLYKFAKAMGYDIICRKVDYCHAGSVQEKRFIEDESAFKSGLGPSVDGLKEVIFRMEMEEYSSFYTYEKRIEECRNLEELDRVNTRFRKDLTLTDEEKRKLEIIAYEKADHWLP